jgi:hypothetical protein
MEFYIGFSCPDAAQSEAILEEQGGKTGLVCSAVCCIEQLWLCFANTETHRQIKGLSENDAKNVTTTAPVA